MIDRENAVIAGQMSLEGDVLRYSCGDGGFHLSAPDIALIGEYTTPFGPGAQDYFLVFVTSDGAHHEAPFYAEGRDAVLDGLSRRLNESVMPRLAASTELASRILWPARYAGQPLFDYQPRPATGLLGRLRGRIGLAALEESWSTATLNALLDDARQILESDLGRALALTQIVLDHVAEMSVPDRRVHGRAWKEHGTALYLVGRYDAALDAAERSRTHYGSDLELASDRAAAMLLTALAQNALHQNRAALAVLDECTSVFTAHGDSERTLKALELRAIVLFDMGQKSEAFDTLLRARTQVEASGDVRELARIENNIGRWHLAEGQFDEAMHYFERAVSRFSQLGMVVANVRAWRAMAKVDMARGNKNEAKARLQRALRKLETLSTDVPERQEVTSDLEELEAA